MRNGSSSKTRAPKAAPDGPTRFEPGGGNVFTDLGLPNPELLLAKADLVRQLRNAIAARKLTTAQAAGLLGIEETKLKLLLRGHTERYTIDRLFRFLNALGQRVEITVRPNGDGQAPVVVR